MKKVLLLMALAILGQFAIAQDLQRQNANNYQRQAQQLIDAADDYKALAAKVSDDKAKEKNLKKADKQMSDAKILMQKAKTSIDAASEHESTMNQGKTWHYYAVIYYKIGAYPEFIDLEPEAYTKVLTAIDKIRQLDNDYYMRMGQELAQYVRSIDNSYYQLGVDSFNNGNYEEAMVNFQKANEAAEKINAVDDAALSNYATCAMKVGKYAEAAATYEMLISKGYEEVGYYSGLINAYRELGDGEKSVAMIEVARAKYPEDPQLVNDMINTYLTLHREGEIIEQIEAMAVKYPEQPVYYMILGQIFGNSESSQYDVDKALEYYEKAIAEKSDYSDAYYEAGALLMNNAADIYKKANDEDPSAYSNFNAYLKATDDMSAQAKTIDERAVPYMEKAYELLPNDEAVKHALKTLYTRLKLMDKAKELD
jgi:hypothetical protein